MKIQKRVILSLSIFILTTGSMLPTAHAADTTQELNDYTDIQSLLAKDTFIGVTAAAQKLSNDAKANHHAALAKGADQLALAKDLRTARAQFEIVSKAALPLAKADHSKNYEIVYCPMKKARWVQKAGSIANPFYGNEMLECGVKE